MNKSYHILWKKQDEKPKFRKNMVKNDKKLLRLENGCAILSLEFEMRNLCYIFEKRRI